MVKRRGMPGAPWEEHDLETLQAKSLGLTDGQIAKNLCISYQSIGNRMGRIYNILGLYDGELAERVGNKLSYAVCYALRHKLIEGPPTQKYPPDFSPIELRVVSFISQGCSDEQIAAHLSKSLRWVKRYVANAYQKYDASSRTHLAALALVHGLIQ